MKTYWLFILSLMVSGVAVSNHHYNDLKSNFVVGNPEILSINALAFGPEGILFIGDSRRAEIFALDTKDQSQAAETAEISVDHIDQKLADLLGTTVDAITIQDMAVNPVSKNIYFAIHANDGQPLLIRLAGQNFENVSLTSVGYSSSSLENAISEDAEDRRGRPLRQWAISDLSYFDGKVMVSGLSNEEFSSTFRTIHFPFEKGQAYSSLEIYHAAHGQYETHSPIKTFMPYELHGKPHLIASYTCTPLVIFPLEEMAPGQHTKGKTVAELGNRNTPLDIVSYRKDGKEFILLANTSRALMKIDPAKIETYRDFLVEPVEENSATAGVEFVALPYVQVQQMDKLDDENILLLQRMSDGNLNLHTAGSKRL